MTTVPHCGSGLSLLLARCDIRSWDRWDFNFSTFWVMVQVLTTGTGLVT